MPNHPDAASDTLAVVAAAAAAAARGPSLDDAVEAILRAATALTGSGHGTVLLAIAPGELEPTWTVGPEPPADAATERLPLVVGRDGLEEVVGELRLAEPMPVDGVRPASRALEAIADILATTIDRARLDSLAQERADWAERLAQADPLTGLANARTLARVLELELARAGRQGGEVSVAVFDIDRFGSLNATAGRAAGDDVLRRVAGILADQVRLVDTVARTGADEFVVVAPGSAGSTVAGRIIAAVGSAVEAGASVSAGVARFPTDGATADDVLGAARAALAMARSAGTGRMAAAGADA